MYIDNIYSPEVKTVLVDVFCCYLTCKFKLRRNFDRLDLSTGEYTPLCSVPEHCFNGCGISADNEIFCREVWLSVAPLVFDRKGGMKSKFRGIFTVWENAFL